MQVGSSRPPVGPIVHRAKRTVLTPRRRWRRRRHRDDDPALVGLLEHFEYSDPIHAFLARVAEEPDLLHDLRADVPPDLVLDVGGFIGEWCGAVAARTNLPIHVFEPSIWARDRLLAVTDRHDHVVVHTYGVGAADGTASLSRIGPGSTLYAGSDEWERADVPLRDVRAVFAELEFERAFLKLNIEGGEYDVLDRLIEAGDIGRVSCLLVQFHEWLPRAHHRRRRILRRLRETHRVEWTYPWVWERWQRR